MYETALLLVIGLLYLVGSRFRGPLIEPGRLFLIPWAASLVLLSLGLIKHDLIMTMGTFAQLALALSSFWLGSMLARLVARRRALAPRHLPRPPLVLLGALTFLTVVYVGLVAWKAFTTPDILSLQSLRQQHWENFWTGQTSSLDLLQTLSRSGTIILAASLPYLHATRARLRFQLASTGGILALLSETLLAGGRGLAMNVLVVLAISWLLVYMAREQTPSPIRHLWRRHKTRALTLGMVGTLLMYTLLAVFPVSRNSALADPERIDTFLGFAHGAALSERSWWLSEHLPVPLLPQMIYGLAYLMMPIPRYTFFIENSDIEEWYAMGQYNWPTLAKLRSVITGKRNTWIEYRAEIGSISEQYGYSPNPWATGVRDFVIDFGVIGAAFALFIFGFLAQNLYHSVVARPRMEKVVFYGLIGLVIARFAFSSMFVVGPVLNTLYLSAALAVLMSVARTVGRHRDAGLTTSQAWLNTG